MPSLPVKYWRFGIKPVVFAASLIPALWLALQWHLAYAGEAHGLGFNPYEFTNRFSGDWAIRFLLACLSLTPIALLTRWKRPLLFRRMLGLFAFFYAMLHVTGYLVLDLELDLGALVDDIIKRNYITVGMAALVILIPLAATSFNRALKYLGGRKWQKLHRLSWLAGALVCLHFFMMRKGFQMEPVWYAVWLFAGLGVRAWYRSGRISGHFQLFKDKFGRDNTGDQRPGTG